MPSETCPECLGAGWIIDRSTGWEGEDCVACDGTGEVEAEEVSDENEDEE